MSHEDGDSANGWTPGLVRVHVLALLHEREKLFDARLVEKDLRDQQRFDAQQRALNDALIAQEKAVAAALAAAKEAVAAALCVSVDTPVLCADLVWRPAGTLERGDELITVDELSGFTTAGRRFRRAIVTTNSQTDDELLTVTTTHGVVRCNNAHPWLVWHGHNTRWEWKPAGAMVIGDKVDQPLDVWEQERSYEAGWLAGMYDGEGWLTVNYDDERHVVCRLGVCQAEGDTSDALMEAVGSRAAMTIERHNRPPYQVKMVYMINSRADVMKMLGSVRPARLLAKAAQVWEGRSIRRMRHDTFVTAIEPAGVGAVANLSTSTGTYIAGGFVMHNTAAKEAVNKAETAQGHVNESQNEFRGTLRDQAATLMPRAESELVARELRIQLDDLRKSRDSTAGAVVGAHTIVKAEQASSFEGRGQIAIGISIVSMGIVIVDVLLKFVK